ncbi:MAG: hypothetical protein ACE5OP_08735 [Candidatus Glassbacteria bacterium]
MMRVYTLLAYLALISLVFTTDVWSYNTNSLLLVIIDGMRNQEAFEDSTHAYIPHIWNDLRPLGTIYTNFYTMVRTGTTPGHQVLLSGVRTDMVNNHGLLLSSFRSRYPTVFEYFRSSSGIPADSVWIVSGKRNLNTCDYSLHPAYGPDYATMSLMDIGHDTTTFDVLLDVLGDYHPRLMLINFKDVDVRGHVGTYEEYTTAIQVADSLIFELYNYLQTDDFYAGNVTLFITTDHGRIDDPNGGYKHHGLGTHGDRSCFFIALGPDIKDGKVVEDVRTFIDIAPTIGELMGFDTPFAEGRVMQDMFLEVSTRKELTQTKATLTGSMPSPTNVSNTSSASLFPSVAVTDTSIYILWSEEDPTSQNENRRILISNSNDGGSTWSSPETLFENGQVDGTVYRGDISWSESAGLIATVNGYYGYTDQLGFRTYRWFVAYSTSTNGVGWSTPTPIFDYSSVWRTIILNPPRAALDSAEIQLDWVVESWFVAKESTDGGNSFSTVLDYHKNQLITNEYFTSHDVAMDSHNVYYIVEKNTLSSGTIYYLSLDRSTGSVELLWRIDPDSTGSFRPSLGVGNGIVHVIWNDLTDGLAGVYHRMSIDGIDSFTDPSLISEENMVAWNPDIAVSGDTLVVVWEDYRDGIGEIYSRRSLNGGSSWGEFMRETTTSGFSVHPRVDSWGGNFHLTWQDNSSGNWEIYSKPIILE